METTWKPHVKHGELTERSDLPDSVFAFPKQRKEPMTDASHVRNAIARFDQTIGVSDEDRKLAFANIKKAAKHYGVDISESDWTELGKHPSTHRTAEDRNAPTHSRRFVADWYASRGLGSTIRSLREPPGPTELESPVAEADQ